MSIGKCTFATSTDEPQSECAILCQDWRSAVIRSSDASWPVRDRIHCSPSSENTGMPLLELKDPSRQPAKWREPRTGCSMDDGVEISRASLLKSSSLVSEVSVADSEGPDEGSRGRDAPVFSCSVLARSRSNRSTRSSSWLRCCLLMKVSEPAQKKADSCFAYLERLFLTIFLSYEHCKPR